MQQMYVYASTLGDGSNGGVYIYTYIHWVLGVAQCGGSGVPRRCAKWRWATGVSSMQAVALHMDELFTPPIACGMTRHATALGARKDSSYPTVDSCVARRCMRLDL